MNMGLIGGFGGLIIGIIGGIIGTYFSIKNTKTDAEKKLMIKFAVILWIYAILFITVLLLTVFNWLPKIYYWIIWGSFIILLGPSIYWVNKQQTKLRNDGKQKK